MPIVTIHEEVAINIANKVNELNNNDFFLGNYAPDSVNLEGFASKEKRWLAHQRRKDLREWRNSLKEFYKKEKENYPKNFILGYITHILTDIIFDDYFYDDIKREILNDKVQSDSHELMGKDMENYFNKSSHKSEIISNLNNIDNYYDILNITSKEMKLFKNKILNTNYSTNDNKYITEDILTKLSKQVLIELKEYLED